MGVENLFDLMNFRTAFHLGNMEICLIIVFLSSWWDNHQLG